MVPDLKLSEIVDVARYKQPVSLSDEGKEAIEASRNFLTTIVAADNPVYGINTGFGIFSDQRIPHNDSAALSRNLILSHAVGTGPNLPEEVVRAAMLVRANTLAKGFSGVRIEIVQTILDMLNSRRDACHSFTGVIRIVGRPLPTFSYGVGFHH